MFRKFRKALKPGGTLLVGVMGSDYIAEVDPQPGNVIRHITTGNGAHNFLASPDGKTLYVTNRVAGTISVLDADTRRELQQRGWVVYLETSVAQQAERAGRTRHRPLLHGADPAQRLGELLRVREPLYREIADLTISTNQRRVPAVAEFIAQQYHESLAAVACRP